MNESMHGNSEMDMGAEKTEPKEKIKATGKKAPALTPFETDVLELDRTYELLLHMANSKSLILRMLSRKWLDEIKISRGTLILIQDREAPKTLGSLGGCNETNG
jgi:hypothetical protein